MAHPDVDSLIHSLEAQDLPALCASMGNVLEEVTVPAYPVIQGIREQMLQCGGTPGDDERKRPYSVWNF